MALPSSGAISLNDVNIELGIASGTNISMNASGVRTLFGVASGAITMNNGYGKANQFGLTIASNTANVDVRSAALAGGWNGTSKVVTTINSGVIVYSTSTGSYAMTISGSFPGGLELINNGTILGKGGNGGTGAGESGFNGGPALQVSTAVSITNGSGRIAGGGGGGGAGIGYTECFQPYKGGCVFYMYHGHASGGGGIGGGTPNGTLTAAGSATSATTFAGGGGAGGGYGSSGGGGTFSGGTGGASSGAAGGAAVVGNSNITWVSTGTRNGSIS